LTASDKWRHPVGVILTSSVNYVAKYLGSMVVANVQGTESTRGACAKMRVSLDVLIGWHSRCSVRVMCVLCDFIIVCRNQQGT
jgi:hypothetical protein